MFVIPSWEKCFEMSFGEGMVTEMVKITRMLNLKKIVLRSDL